MLRHQGREDFYLLHSRPQAALVSLHNTLFPISIYLDERTDMILPFQLKEEEYKFSGSKN